MATEKRRRSSEDERCKDVLSIVSKWKRDEESENERSEDEKMYCRSLSLEERDRRREDGESVNVIKSEALVDELMPIVDRFDAVIKGMSNIVS